MVGDVLYVGRGGKNFKLFDAFLLQGRGDRSEYGTVKRRLPQNSWVIICFLKHITMKLSFMQTIYLPLMIAASGGRRLCGL